MAVTTTAEIAQRLTANTSMLTTHATDANIAIGSASLDAIAGNGGVCNIAIGKTALSAVTSGCLNVGIGLEAGDALTSGLENIAIGKNALGAATTGCENTAIGTTAMGGADTTGIRNIAIGGGSLDALTTGLCNISIGTNALGASTTACNNIGIGEHALGTGAMTGNGYNVAVGVVALQGVTSGLYNIGIGYRAGCDVTTTDCTINIGYGMTQTTAAVSCIGGGCLMSAQFTATSDCRSKCKIKDLPYGLSFINLLRPVSYKWKPQADKLDKEGNLVEKGEWCHTHQRTMFGLLGQQVKGALDKLGLSYNDFAGYSDQEYENRNNPDWKKSYTMEDKTIQLTYDDFIAPLIKSVQELSAEVTELKAKLKTT